MMPWGILGSSAIADCPAVRLLAYPAVRLVVRACTLTALSNKSSYHSYEVWSVLGYIHNTN